MIEVSPAKTTPTVPSVKLSPEPKAQPILLSVIDNGLQADTASAAAAQLCTALAQKLDALRVTLVWRAKPTEKQSLNILGHSNHLRVDLGEQQSQWLQNAAYEAIDQENTIWFATGLGKAPATPGFISVAHRQLAQGPCGLALSVVLANDIQFGHKQQPAACFGALVIELPSSHPLAEQPALLQTALQDIAPPICRLILLAQRAQRKRDRWFARFGKPAKFKLASVFAALMVLGLLLLPIRDPISAPARLEGEIQRQVTAPVAGILKSVHVRPGETVKAGQLIAQLQEQDFELENSRLQGEFSQHELAMRNAMAKGDRSAMVQAQAKLEEVTAQLNLVKTQLSSIQLRAPINGVLISGDMQPLIGNPIDRGQLLAQVAPAARFRVVVEIDERDLRRVKMKQTGEITLSALPFTALPLEVERIGPAAVQLEQRAAIEVFAQLSQANQNSSYAQLRPGLRGVAHLESGYRPLAFIWGQRLLEYWRLFSWRWLPWLS